MLKRTNLYFNFLLLVTLFMLLTSCQNPTPSPVVSVIPTATIATSENTESISPIVTPSITSFMTIPTPSQGVATVYGIILDSKGSPLPGIPVYLGKFDGLLVEISLNHSPKTITDDSGNFVFTSIPSNDDSFQYTVGVILGNTSATIIKEPGSNKTFVFDATEGEMIDLGALKSDF